ncbi:hypothetical protein Cgig2_015005 [Carnegiea gigantea]|uniref:Uncharacterized protein n=1 Tax=Carnegiea gigantea TaxID=171969 RepID=A0A9Q1GI49_9CARY|nr:hypothetical protein Cgig2_015005 [Carnegiea gigantea]
MLHHVEDIEGISQYNWAEAVWRVVVETIEDTQKKLCAGPLTEVQLNGLCRLIQLIMGRYDASELLKDIKKEEEQVGFSVQVIPILYPQDTELLNTIVTQFMATEEFGYYVDDLEGWLSVDERLRCARDAYLLEKKANESTRNEVQMLREQVAQLEGKLKTTSNSKGGELESSADIEAAHEETCGTTAEHLPDVRYAYEGTTDIGGLRNEAGAKCDNEMGGVGACDQVEREGTDAVSGDNGDRDKELKASSMDGEEDEQRVNLEACTPKNGAKDSSRWLQASGHDACVGNPDGIALEWEEGMELFSKEVR